MKTIIQILILISFFSYVAKGQNDQVRRLLVRAETAIKLEQYEDAVKEYEAALKIDPANANIYYNLAAIQEKIGTTEALSDAIRNYKKYLSLSPNDKDYNKIENKVYSLEFQVEKQNKAIEQFENVKGIWRSNWHYKETGIPFWFFNLEQFNSDLRITALSNSGLYRTDFTYQTITIPYTGDMLTFTFTNDTKYQPSNIETSIQHSILNATTNSQTAVAFSPLLHGLIDMSANQPFPSICTYIFKLNLSLDSLYGTCQTIVRRIDAKSDKIVKDEVTHMVFTKSDQNYPAMTKEQIKENKRIKRKSIPSFKVYYSKPFGSTASQDVTSRKPGFYTNGFGLGFSWKTLEPTNKDFITGNIAEKLQITPKRKIVGGCINLNAYYYKLSAPYGLKITGAYPKTNNAKYADIVEGQTNGSNFGFDFTLGQFGYLGINKKAFMSYTFCPIGFAEEVITTAKVESYSMSVPFQISYQGELSIGLNFKNKDYTSQGFFLGYNWGIPFITIIESKDETANIYHQPKPKIWKNMLNVGFEYTF
jgi:hypothetical protein